MPRLDRRPQANRSNLVIFLAQVNDTARWCRGETAGAQLLRCVRQRPHVSADPTWKAAASSIAR